MSPATGVTGEGAVDASDLTVAGLLHLVADAYRDAALAEANMRRAADALEAVRAAAPPDAYFEIFEAIDRQIGLSEDTALQRVLARLRERYVEAVVGHELGRLERALADRPEEGWVDWLRTFADALADWRWPLVTVLVEAPLPYPARVAGELEDIRRWTRLARVDRWPEANELLLYLAGSKSLRPDVRGEMYVYSAQIQLYHLFLPEQAVPLLEQAEQLAPHNPAVLLGRAEYELQSGNYDAARARCEQVVEANPAYVGAYNLLGQVCDREDDLEQAEHWYLEAVRVDCGDSSSYENLLRLYGRPELIATHESRLASLKDRAIAVDPDAAYNACIDLGLVYQQNGRYAEAHAEYDRAIALDPDRDGASVQKGYAYLDESKHAEAEQAFRRAVEVAPGAFDGYWGLAALYEALERWPEALDCFAESLERRPEWRPSILARTGSILIQLARYDEAEEQLLEALRLDPGNDSTTSSLERLVGASYADPARTEVALRILETMLELKGREYEPTQRNLVGNIAFYFERYDDAIEAYRRAIELQPGEPVYHSNLAGAWEARRQPGERREELASAIAAARKAVELDPGEEEYAGKLASLLAEQGLVERVGELALNLQWPPRVRVDVGNPLLPAVLDERQDDVSPEVLATIEAMRGRIAADTGVWVPGIRFRELAVDEASYVVSLDGTPLPAERVQLDKYFCPPPFERLVLAGIPAEIHAQSLPGAWIDEDARAAAAAAGIDVWAPAEVVVRQIERVLRARLDGFVDHDQVVEWLAPAAAGADVAQDASLLSDLVVVLRALVHEGVPIVAVDAIVDAFLALSREGIGRVELVERVRRLPEIAPSLPGNDRQAVLRPLDPAFEAALQAARLEGEGGPWLALSRRDAASDVDALRRAARFGEQVALVVANAELRPLVAALVESVPDVCVIARDELVAERRAELEEQAVGAA